MLLPDSTIQVCSLLHLRRGFEISLKDRRTNIGEFEMIKADSVRNNLRVKMWRVLDDPISLVLLTQYADFLADQKLLFQFSFELVRVLSFFRAICSNELYF